MIFCGEFVEIFSVSDLNCSVLLAFSSVNGSINFVTYIETWTYESKYCFHDTIIFPPNRLTLKLPLSRNYRLLERLLCFKELSWFSVNWGISSDQYNCLTKYGFQYFQYYKKSGPLSLDLSIIFTYSISERLD